MFEDSTFESNNRIRTRSRGWMIAAFSFNASIVLALILIPLIYPEALPRMAMAFLMEVPTAPQPLSKPVHMDRSAAVQQEIKGGQIFAPRKIPIGIFVPGAPEEPSGTDVATADLGGPANNENPFANQPQHPVVRQEPRGPVRVSGSIVAGLLIDRRIPVYPAIAKASGTQGTVVLQATISRNGTIENLHVISGPAMLQVAAMDAVKAWRYRPYLLSGEPVEVETTVNVVFKLAQ